MKVYQFFCLVFLIGTAEAADIKPEMHVLAQEISAMQKFLLTDAEFSDAKNDTAIKSSLNKISEHLSFLGKSPISDNAALRVNLNLIQQHIADAKKSFEAGSKSYARFMMQSSMQMCIACHTRTKTSDFALPEVDLSKVKLEDQGDYFFATRQFDKGKEVFSSMILDFPKNMIGQFALRKALVSMAIYFSRVKSDPKAGADFFTQVSKVNGLPSYIKKEASEWAKDFKDWGKEPEKNSNSLTESQLLMQAKKILKSDDLSLVSDNGRSFHIRRLRASVLLHKILESPGTKSPAKGEAIYYLGQIYHRISSNLFFRFGEMYLKTCISEYQKTATARNCYDALERAVSEGYTGSGGSDIPDEEEIELVRLRRLAY